MPENTHTAYLALGSNLGDRLRAMRQAIHHLRDCAHLHTTPEPRAGSNPTLSGARAEQRMPRSRTIAHGRTVRTPCIHIDLDTDIASLYESDPVGGPPNQGPYLNSAVRVSTTLTPHELLDAVLSIEASMGRVRDQRWEPRVIDIDVLLYDDLIINDERLTLPHPYLHQRRFVLDPLAEIAGSVVHPVLKVSIGELARKVHDQEPTQDPTRVGDPPWALVGWALPTTG